MFDFGIDPPSRSNLNFGESSGKGVEWRRWPKYFEPPSSNFLNNRLIDKQNQFGEEERDSILGSLLFIQERDHCTLFCFPLQFCGTNTIIKA